MEDRHNMADGGSVACLEAFNMFGLLQLLFLKNIEEEEVGNRDVNQFHLVSRVHAVYTRRSSGMIVGNKLV